MDICELYNFTFTGKGKNGLEPFGVFSLFQAALVIIVNLFALTVLSLTDPFEVRLDGGSNNTEGRIEVLYNGSWGTICDDNWHLLDAGVVCRMLGFDGAVGAPEYSRTGQGSGRVLLTNVWCLATTTTLARCYHGEIGDTSGCIHERDAGAICYSGDPFEVRLVDGSNNTEGRVEVLYNGSWGTICDGFWDLRDAWVVCKMLGFDGALEAPRSARFGQGPGRIVLTRVECYGTEDNLKDCVHGGVGNWSGCGHKRDAGAICYSGEHPSPLQVRLVNGSNHAEGRVEVMYNGSWGTVCDMKWDLRDASVICKMLGYDGALDAPKSAWFGQGSGRILLTLVDCDGTEDNLADCIHQGDWRLGYMRP
ncbi:deleted in malignant brain tumors 1 protein-like [Lytechinus variegatus]|uniref:deleted in malignant brain tumors 1 protein-like n=1 Tax=Lytechinus variegatus TaxID=7654 RepID=UPI001BB289ED|nr:deleted in malignant brain tumors 1 protein-like [Lytechinus variegatus]